ncbi:uncharacterized protein J3R85_008486 [Psidium guajava]|nr:uncharacterized protein J3R85_008486 [Psidium guajava]
MQPTNNVGALSDSWTKCDHVELVPRPSGKAAEFGPLKDGYSFECSTGLSRTLLSSPTCPVLEEFGKKLSFEIAVGLNGRVWENAASPSTIIVVSNAIMKSESLSGVQQRIMVQKLLDRIQ